MVITKDDYFKIRLPYYKVTAIWFVSLLFYIISLMLAINFLQSKNLAILILFLLVLTAFLFLKSVLIIIGSILENIGLFIFESIILFLLIYSYYGFFNLNFLIYFLPIFYIFNILLIWSLIRYYNNQPKLNFGKIFLISWNYYLYILLISLFLIIFFFDFSSLSKDKIVNFVGSLNYIFEVLNVGITPNTTIEDVLGRNLPPGLDDSSRKEMINLALSELNKNFRLKLQSKTTVKEAIGDFIISKLQEIKNSESTLTMVKILLSIVLLLFLKYILTFLGYILSLFALLIFVLLKSLELVKIEYEKIDKEVIKI